ncbi:MAG: SHOCT domain-containing protein [Chloroflexi bacterium]|nr:SHOCT domain-containing protein [Chloroflexota bacterium]
MQKMTTQAFNQMGASSQTSPQDSRNLVKQLKQLQEAKAAGLISEIEFERLRQEILDKWTDG